MRRREFFLVAVASAIAGWFKESWSSTQAFERSLHALPPIWPTLRSDVDPLPQQVAVRFFGGPDLSVSINGQKLSPVRSGDTIVVDRPKLGEEMWVMARVIAPNGAMITEGIAVRSTDEQPIGPEVLT